MAQDNFTPPDEKFVPRGAVAFFALLMLIILVIWFAIYFIMLSRT